MVDTNKPQLTQTQLPPAGTATRLSTFTNALIKSWHMGIPKSSTSATKISVSQTVSFVAFLYEKMRNAIEFQEENLIRRSAIDRIIRRRMLLNENGRDIAEPLIKELLWARYYENNTIGEEKISELQSSIDKYFFIRNELAAGRNSKEQEKIVSFIMDVLSCEIEEILSPSPRREAFTNFAYQLLRYNVAPFNGNDLEKDIQVYIAVEKTFAHSDEPLIRYHLLRLMLPEITDITWKTADQVMPKFFDVYAEIEKSISHPFSDKTRNYIKKQIPPYLILQDIFKQNDKNILQILEDGDKLKEKVDIACRKRYDETRGRLRRTGVRSFIYIILTKVVFAFILELPYDIYVIKSVNYIPILINVLFPPILMSIIILSVSVPGDENTRRIHSLIEAIVTFNPDTQSAKHAFVIGRKPRAKNPVFGLIFSALYLFTYVISFGSIIYLLNQMNFNPISSGIFIFFVTLVTFFAFRVITITQEYLVIDREGPLTPIVDFFFLPVIHVGQWLSGEVLTKFNFFIFIFDFIIEMPLKAVVEVVDEWIHFVKLKKEEII